MDPQPLPDDIVPHDIVPDDKDWTWVLERPCPECGFEARACSVDTVPALIRDNAERWQEVLDSAGPASAVRTRPDRWSTLEYAAHVRDVFRLYHERLRLMLDTDDPLFANWDQDATAIADRYAEQDPVVVAGELTAAAAVLAETFADVRGDRWDRPGRRSDGASFTIETFARYMIHDPVHHLWDVSPR
jgi:DinB superfamily